MGIASGIFWIVFGLLYIWYKALREEPEATISGTLACIILVGGIIAHFFIYDWLLNVNMTLAAIVGFVPLAALLFLGIKVKADQDAERIHTQTLYKEAKKIVDREEYTEEEIAEYTKKWLRTSPDRWKYNLYGAESCRDLIIESYRKYVRYGKVFNELRHADDGERRNK